ncbi:MAG: SagB/ThcOx family dehydrogenase [Candidatus Omnitrophica bacterium]|nr:SagB/ThcOx family dehydrogenase [Candidatus Omnitrophota bacterium]
MKSDEMTINLTKPKLEGDMSLEETIQKRRSVRSFSGEDLTLEEVSQLCWAAQGITGKRRPLRSAPSAGARYPLEVYLIQKGGTFHYIPEGHKLERISGEDLRSELSAQALGQSPVKDAALDIVIAAVYDRVSSKYGERGRRYSDIEAGHAAQNIHLQAVALGLGSVPMGAFDDDGVKDLLGLADNEEPIYIIPVGHPK